MLTELSYYDTINGRNRLLYSEKAARALEALALPAFRLASVQGKYPAVGKQAKEVYLLEIVSALVSRPSESQVPALSPEEEAVAMALLDLLAYAQWRELNLGRAIMLVHLRRSEV